MKQNILRRPIRPLSPKVYSWKVKAAKGPHSKLQNFYTHRSSHLNRTLLCYIQLCPSPSPFPREAGRPAPASCTRHREHRRTWQGREAWVCERQTNLDRSREAGAGQTGQGFKWIWNWNFERTGPEMTDKYYLNCLKANEKIFQIGLSCTEWILYPSRKTELICKFSLLQKLLHAYITVRS